MSEESSPLAIETKEFAFLKALYDLTGGNTNENASLRQIKTTTKFDDKTIAKVITSLIKENKVRTLGIQDLMQLTYQGKQYVDLFSATQTNVVPTRKPYNIFISHISENESIAKKLKEFLKGFFSDKVEVFFSGDPQNIPAGQDWFATIIDGIKQCNCMIILCSPKSIERKWIHFEAGGAAVIDSKIIPLCFAGLSPSNLPSPLDQIRTQAIDSDDTDKFQQHFGIFLKEIAEYVDENRPVPDVLQSEFYQELQFAHPRNNRPPLILPRTFLKKLNSFIYLIRFVDLRIR